jgi:hypothetical protein
MTYHHQKEQIYMKPTTPEDKRRESTLHAKLIHFLSIYFIWFNRAFGVISPQNIHSEVKILKYLMTWWNKVK